MTMEAVPSQTLGHRRCETDLAPRRTVSLSSPQPS